MHLFHKSIVQYNRRKISKDFKKLEIESLKSSSYGKFNGSCKAVVKIDFSIMNWSKIKFRKIGKNWFFKDRFNRSLINRKKKKVGTTTVSSACSSQCWLLLHQRNIMHQSYRWQLHVWMDKRVAIFMEWYNVTDRCYPLQLCYAVIFCTL